MKARLVAIIALTILCCPCVDARAADIHRAVLQNGLRLILCPNPAAELVAISVCIRTEPDRTPLDDAAGELVARSLFSSSLNRSPDKLSAGIALVGGSLEVVRTAEHVDVTCVTLPAQVREAIFLLCEVLKNAEFGGLEQARAELMLEQPRTALGSAGGMDLLRRELQARPDPGDLPYRRVSRAQVEAYFHTRYVPARTAIAVAGNFVSASVQSTFRDALADYDRPAARISTAPLYSHATNYPTRTLSQPGASGYALVATPAPPLTDADFAAFVVLRSILGDGHASRLFRRLRDAKGIGYNVGALWQTGLSDPLVAYLQWEARAAPAGPVPNGVVESTARRALAENSAVLTPEFALRLLTSEIDALITDPPTDAEVARARSLAAGRENLRHERARDRAFLLALYEAMGVGAEFDSALQGKLAAVTRADVLRVAQRYLTPRASVTIVPDR